MTFEQKQHPIGPFWKPQKFISQPFAVELTGLSKPHSSVGSVGMSVKFHSRKPGVVKQKISECVANQQNCSPSFTVFSLSDIETN